MAIFLDKCECLTSVACLKREMIELANSQMKC